MPHRRGSRSSALFAPQSEGSLRQPEAKKGEGAARMPPPPFEVPGAGSPGLKIASCQKPVGPPPVHVTATARQRRRGGGEQASA